MNLQEGYRHAGIRSEGMRIAESLMEDDSFDVLGEMMERLREYNEQHCVPPKSIGDIYQIAYDCMKSVAKKIGDEEGVRERVLKILAPHFHIHREVTGDHWSGRRIRIDAIVIPKDDSAWKTKQPRLGIEFKNFNGFHPALDMKDYTRWWSQCHDYAETNFDGHGYVYVFSYNGFSHYRKRAAHPSTAAMAVRFWGRLGVGELAPCRHFGLTFSLQETRVWSEKNGDEQGARTWSMSRKFGSR